MSNSSEQINSIEYAQAKAALQQRHQQELEQLYELIESIEQQKQENSQLQQRIEDMESQRNFSITENQRLRERERELKNKVVDRALALVINTSSKLAISIKLA